MFRLRQLVTFRYPGPIKVLTLGLVLSAILLPILGFVMWSTYESLVKMSEHSLNLQRGARTVARRNELLTMHARLAAATGDPKWERQYRRIEPELDSALLRVLRSSSKSAISLVMGVFHGQKVGDIPVDC